MNEEMRKQMEESVELSLEGIKIVSSKFAEDEELARNYAGAMRNFYDALIGKGFTEKQAIKLVQGMEVGRIKKGDD